MAGPLIAISLAGQRSVSDGVRMTAVAERNWVALDLLADELQRAISDSIVVSDFGRTLRFTPAVGLNGAEFVAGSHVRFEFRTSSWLSVYMAVDGTESINSIYEGEDATSTNGLVRVDEGSGSEQILSGYLSPGSRFLYDGETVFLRVVTSVRTQQGNRVYTIARSIIVKPRN